MTEIYSTPSTIVFGANGQDGFFMCRFLLKKNIKVLAVVRKNSENINLLYKNYKKNLTIIKYSQTKNKNFKFLINHQKSNVFFFAGFSKIPKNKSERQKCINSNYIFFQIRHVKNPNWKIK